MVERESRGKIDKLEGGRRDRERDNDESGVRSERRRSYTTVTTNQLERTKQIRVLPIR
jgi:hypothetical protein